MSGVRHLLLRRPAIAMIVVLAALLARLAIPTGYMPMMQDGRLVITLCSGQGPMPAPVMHHEAMPNMAGMAHGPAMHAMAAHTHHHGAEHDHGDHGKDGPCAFSGLSLPSLAAADPLLLAIAILFIVATLYRRPHQPARPAPRFLWPPRTGPPVLA